MTVRGDTTHPITIHLEPCGTIQGRLVDQGGKPVPSTNIAFSEDDGPGCPKATTDAMGRFQLDLFTGLKHTWVQPQNQAKAVSAIQVSPGEIRNLGDLVLKPRFIPPRIPKP